MINLKLKIEIKLLSNFIAHTAVKYSAIKSDCNYQEKQHKNVLKADWVYYLHIDISF